MNTIKFTTNLFKVSDTKNPDYKTIRAVDIAECRTYQACIGNDVAALCRVHKADSLAFTFAHGKIDDNYKCYLNRLESEGSVIYDGYAERNKDK